LVEQKEMFEQKKPFFAKRDGVFCKNGRKPRKDAFRGTLSANEYS